jgi:hypothetical protein
MDNASIHCNPRIEEVIQEHGCEIHFLPPYSPDFNPIELSFSVLKAWVQKHFQDIQPGFNDFGDFLQYTIHHSQCNQFGKEHFKHSAGSYIFEADIQELESRLAAGDIQIDFADDQ